MTLKWKVKYYNEQNKYILLVYPELQRLINIDERFICCNIKNDCWNWMGARGSDGYGNIRYNETYHRVPRLVFQLLNNVILPRNIDTCHTCDNGACYNIDHLFSGTRRVNVLDMDRKKRGRYAPKGSRH